MMVKAEQEDLKRSLMSTITKVCSERLKAKGISQFNIEGLLAVTLEKDQVILVNVNENISCTPPPPQPPVTVQQQQQPVVNGSQSVLCSIVSKAPLVVSPLQLTNGSQQLSQSITLEDFAKTTVKPSEAVKHKAATADAPPSKKRLLEAHLTSHLDGVSILEEVVIKQEVLSDDEDFASGSLTQQSLDPLIEEANVVNVAESDLAKMVRSDKMWNQHPIAQLTVAQAAAISTLSSSIPTGSSARQQRAYSLPGHDSMDYDFNGIKEEDDEEDDDDDDTSSYLNGTSSLDSSPSFVSPVTDEQEFLRLARSILLYKGTFITVHSFCKVSRRTGKNAMLKISSERACYVMQKMNVPAWDEKYIGEYKELRKGTKVFFKCPPDMVNPKALAYYGINLQTYRAGYYEESKSASFPTKTELLKRIFDASPY